jgi:hypothetical protein
MSNEINWTDRGIRWDEETVSKQAGDNRSDKVAFHLPAHMPIVVDLEKFITAVGGPQRVLDLLDGQGVRIVAQRVNRTELAKGSGVDVIRTAVWNALIAVRSPRTTAAPKIIMVHGLPNGTKYEGMNETEWRQMYTAQLVDAGVDAKIAMMIANGMAW